MSDHAPNVWHVEAASHGWNVLSADGKEVAAGDGSGAFWLREHADLAAAAPELLAYAECEEAWTDFLRGFEAPGRPDLQTVLARHGCPEPGRTANAGAFIHGLRRKALAKAKGGDA